MKIRVAHKSKAWYACGISRRNLNAPWRVLTPIVNVDELPMRTTVCRPMRMESASSKVRIYLTRAIPSLLLST